MTLAATLPWLGFTTFVLAMLAVDLGLFHRKPHAVSIREALTWSAVWIGLALLFNLGIYLTLGKEKGFEFLTAYVIEKSLSLDNVFVFVLLFGYFRVPQVYQHKVLFWGVLGALLMRAVFVAAGVALLQWFHPIIYLFGALLLLSGVKMFFLKGHQSAPTNNWSLKVLKRIVPVTNESHGSDFFVRLNGVLHATPLFAVLVLVEVSDLIFAVDSIPAILAISSDPFIVWTSNVFAILGLRSLYFAIGGLMELFAHLHYGLAAILTFVGGKMLLADIYPIPIQVSLGVILALLATSVGSSLISRRMSAARASV
jgi:tellurite resistance protein TerC